MQARLLLGPAGSGKTFRCLTEVRQALASSAEGPPLLLIAPKQGTYQLEQRLLAEPSLPGYTRLRILSFEGLAHFVFSQLNKAPPDVLDEEGRLMVLRALLSEKREGLKLFRASARLTGFAQQLSLVLREFQRNQLTPESLRQLANQVRAGQSLSGKLQDLAVLLQHYIEWLEAHSLEDADGLLDAAMRELEGNPKSEVRSPKVKDRGSESAPEAALSGFDLRPSFGLRPSDFGLHISHLWLDGFAEFSEQELGLLTALLPCCDGATITLCLDCAPKQKASWISHWSVGRKTFEHCQARFARLPGVGVVVETIFRDPCKSRFHNNPILHHLEKHWADPKPYRESVSVVETKGGGRASGSALERTLRLATCADPEGEVTLAAREILRYMRDGGRYRDISVVVRALDLYHQPIQRVFSHYEIPFFLDRRESVAHHPLAELTRSALRTVIFGWQHEDWFAALKSGLMPADDREIDRLETEALAHGWKGAAWHQPLRINNLPRSPREQASLQRLQEELEKLRHGIVPPFERLALALTPPQNKPTGRQLAAALRELWSALGIHQRLEGWTDAEPLTYESSARGSVHETVWNQLNTWLDNVELAFPAERLSLREWMPILEAGLASLTVGVVPPALDQVLVGAIDRSRTPDVKLVLILGLNEGVFPAPLQAPLLLTETDRVELEEHGLALGAAVRQHIGLERYYAYIACTRAQERVVMTSALHDAAGSPLNPSPFLSQVRQIFPTLQQEMIPKALDWRDSEHLSDLAVTVLKMLKLESGRGESSPPIRLIEGRGDREANACASEPSLPPADPAQRQRSPFPPQIFPSLGSLLDRVRQLREPGLAEILAPDLAARVYGSALRTSVSRMEQFAACPFKFFVHSGLRAEERQLFELDVREQGSFQHDVLALFHDQLRSENKRWRDVTPADARQRVARIAKGLMAGYRDGLLEASEQTRFMVRSLTESLQDFVETLVGWMREQYQFDPFKVELAFGDDEAQPPWDLDLGLTSAGPLRLELRGRIDRVDLCPTGNPDEAFCVVVDYKSSHKQMDTLLVTHGLQLQLLAYLNVLRHWPNPRAIFGVARLIPAGVFYVNLRGRFDRAQNRLEALADAESARKLAYRHAGRFDTRALRQLDSRPDARQGDQFNYRLSKNGEVYKNSVEALATAEFEAMLDSVETNLKRMGRQIYAGAAEVSPYRKGGQIACDQCAYQAICRIDPWTHSYRVLAKAG